MAITGRIKFKAKISSAKIGVPGFTPQRMAYFGNILNNSIKQRFDNALDVNDKAAPPLSERYATYKQGKPYHGIPIRNLQLSGRLRRSMVLLRASTNRATIGFNDAVSDQRMTFNQRRANMYGMSPKDEQVLVAAVREYLNEVVRIEKVA